MCIRDSALVEGLLAAYSPGGEALGRALPLSSRGSLIEVQEVGDGYTDEIEGVTILAGELSGGELPALAWRFERGKRSVVISGTGWAPDALVEFVRDTDLLVHDSVFVPLPEDIEAACMTADPSLARPQAALHTSIE